jgi:hypothetical protein
LAGKKDNPIVLFDRASAGHPSHIMARFGFLDDGRKLNDHIRMMINDEIANHPDDILAEVVHLPEDRTGNILQRPSYYDWEILYLASPGYEAKTIKPDEILVSVVRDQVILKHKTSGRRIIPRLTNAHNYRSRQLPLYQFLAELANEEYGSGYFPDWGWLARMYDFLPGIRYNNLILTQPRWRLKLEDNLRNTRDRAQLYTRIQKWVSENNLPDQVVWSQGDHELFIDWSNFNIVMTAWENIKKYKMVFFKDYPFGQGSPVKGWSGDYANEVILTFKKSLQ